MCKTCERFQDGHCDSNGNQYGPCVHRAEECGCVVLIPGVSNQQGSRSLCNGSMLIVEIDS